MGTKSIHMYNSTVSARVTHSGNRMLASKKHRSCEDLHWCEIIDNIGERGWTHQAGTSSSHIESQRPLADESETSQKEKIYLMYPILPYEKMHVGTTFLYSRIHCILRDYVQPATDYSAKVLLP